MRENLDYESRVSCSLRHDVLAMVGGPLLAHFRGHRCYRDARFTARFVNKT